ncbi:tungstate ABC transporter substrate-binding protein WtpA [Methanoplanus sp. FWC-SCC4]|uniref:Tungstate ABC transporter substrate-binding protein WtpA n=1 Tax=Methanochimaera problematica TaxID=2609417 RepID=A0AA97I3Q9_9EURY|nr:tungstate ABC transporter substrate-binding protein WtpA [Methanoplanus sp. FWC-SCC4]WOF16963.1 tungstate ABC transporter substrate-binding protein WtpA [Methanoplanus sp. FWC-SCC4]
MRNIRFLFLLSLILSVFVLFSGCTTEDQVEKTEIKIVPAGSLLLPLEEIERDFEETHPGTDVIIEGHGSIQCIRQVTDLKRPLDLVIVADQSLIPDMMYIPMPGSTKNYADNYTAFATNEMVIAYTDKSLYSDEITSENWYEILKRSDVKVGFSNPVLDACGYRTFMVSYLANEYYGDTEIFDKILGDHLKEPVEIIKKNDKTEIILPEFVKPSDSKIAVRDGSIFLLYLIESGGVDYGFEYRSVAEGHGLKYVTLPDELNLGNMSLKDYYSTISVKLSFERFSSIGSERVGESVVYAYTVPETATNKNSAYEFAEFMKEYFKEARFGWPDPI